MYTRIEKMMTRKQKRNDEFYVQLEERFQIKINTILNSLHWFKNLPRNLSLDLNKWLKNIQVIGYVTCIQEEHPMHKYYHRYDDPFKPNEKEECKGIILCLTALNNDNVKDIIKFEYVEDAASNEPDIGVMHDKKYHGLFSMTCFSNLYKSQNCTSVPLNIWASVLCSISFFLKDMDDDIYDFYPDNPETNWPLENYVYFLNGEYNEKIYPGFTLVKDMNITNNNNDKDRGAWYSKKHSDIFLLHPCKSNHTYDACCKLKKIYLELQMYKFAKMYDSQIEKNILCIEHNYSFTKHNKNNNNYIEFSNEIRFQIPSGFKLDQSIWYLEMMYYMSLVFRHLDKLSISNLDISNLSSIPKLEHSQIKLHQQVQESTRDIILSMYIIPSDLISITVLYSRELVFPQMLGYISMALLNSNMTRRQIYDFIQKNLKPRDFNLADFNNVLKECVNDGYLIKIGKLFKLRCI